VILPKNQPKRLDSDNQINLSSLIVTLEADKKRRKTALEPPAMPMKLGLGNSWCQAHHGQETLKGRCKWMERRPSDNRLYVMVLLFKGEQRVKCLTDVKYILRWQTGC
jgi:hypothetical protein